jgi:hypothetical protein
MARPVWRETAKRSSVKTTTAGDGNPSRPGRRITCHDGDPENTCDGDCHDEDPP